MNKERLRDDETRSLPTCGSFRKVPVRLIYQQVALGLLELVENDDALLRTRQVFQEVKEPLEQVGVVLPQATAGRRPGIGLDYARKCTAAALDTSFENRIDVSEFRGNAEIDKGVDSSILAA